MTRKIGDVMGERAARPGPPTDGGPSMPHASQLHPAPQKGETYPGACWPTPTENLPDHVEITSAERTLLRQSLLWELEGSLHAIRNSVDTVGNTRDVRNRRRREMDYDTLAGAAWQIELLAAIGLFDAARRPMTIVRPQLIAGIAVVVDNTHELARSEERVLPAGWTQLAKKCGMTVARTGPRPWQVGCDTATPNTGTP